MIFSCHLSIFFRRSQSSLTQAPLLLHCSWVIFLLFWNIGILPRRRSVLLSHHSGQTGLPLLFQEGNHSYLESIQAVAEFNITENPPGWKRVGLHFHSVDSQSNSSPNHSEDTPLAYPLLKQKTRIILQYTACGGLVNQLYSTIAAIALATTMGAELVLPPAVHRDSFAKHFSTKKEANDVVWSTSPLDDILDVDRLRIYWRDRGLIMHPTPSLSPFADCTVPETAYPLYKPAGIDHTFITKLEGIYVKALHIGDLQRRAIERILLHALELVAADPGVEIPAIVLNLPCMLFTIQSSSELQLFETIARSIAFNQSLVEMANNIVSHDQSRDGDEYNFNGVHLRFENDASDWVINMGGERVLLLNYMRKMHLLGFNKKDTIYLASGLLSYGANEKLREILGAIKSNGLGGEFVFKEAYIHPKELGKLKSEQKALIDFLVLSKAKNFVGFDASSFSYFLREYRALKGRAKNTTQFAQSRAKETVVLFENAGTVLDG